LPGTLRISGSLVLFYNKFTPYGVDGVRPQNKAYSNFPAHSHRENDVLKSLEFGNLNLRKSVSKIIRVGIPPKIMNSYSLVNEHEP